MFQLLKAVFILNIKEYIQYSAIKWTRSLLRKDFNYYKDVIKLKTSCKRDLVHCMSQYYIYSFLFSLKMAVTSWHVLL